MSALNAVFTIMFTSSVITVQFRVIDTLLLKKYNF